MQPGSRPVRGPQQTPAARRRPGLSHPCWISLLACIGTSAQPALSAPPAFPMPLRGAAARALLRPWKDCAALSRWSEDDETTQVEARVTPTGAVATFTIEGSGRDGLLYEEKLHLQRSSCATSGYSIYGLKESLDFEVRRIGLDGLPSPSLAEVAALQGANPALVEDRAFAAGRLLLQCAAEDDHCFYSRVQDLRTGALGAPLFPIQPEYVGRPIGGPEALWSPADLGRAQVGALRPDEQDGTRPEAILAGPLRQPWPLTSVGRFELWELRFRARNSGGMLAVYDKARDRHRWVFVTKEDIQEGQFDPRAQKGDLKRPPGVHMLPCQGHFRVLSFDERLLLLATSSREGQYLFAIDPQAGSARPLMAPSRHVHIRRAPGGVEVRPLDDDDKPTGKPTLVPLPPGAR